jgi:hypothetical protein
MRSGNLVFGINILGTKLTDFVHFRTLNWQILYGFRDYLLYLYSLGMNQRENRGWITQLV